MIVAVQKSTSKIPFAFFLCDSIEAHQDSIRIMDKDGQVIHFIGFYNFYTIHEEINDVEEEYVIEQCVELMKGNF